MPRKRKVSLIAKVKAGQESKDMSTPRAANSAIKNRQKKRRIAGPPNCVFTMTAAMTMADHLTKDPDSDNEDAVEMDTKAQRFMLKRVSQRMHGNGGDIKASKSEKDLDNSCYVCGSPVSSFASVAIL